MNSPTFRRRSFLLVSSFSIRIASLPVVVATAQITHGGVVSGGAEFLLLSVSDVLIRRQDCFKVVVTGHFNPSADSKLTGGFQTGICVRLLRRRTARQGL